MRLEWVPHIDRFRPEWATLHRACPDAHPFHSPEWITAWYATVGRLFWPRILAGYEGQELVMVWPMAATLRTWYIAGTGVSDYLSPLSRSTLEAADMNAIFEFLQEVRPALLDFHQLPEEFPMFAGAQIFEQATCLRRSLPESFESLMASVSASMRQDIRRAEKRAATRFRWTDSSEFLPIFYDLHRQRWASKKLPGAFVLRGRQRFHEAFGGSAFSGHRYGLLEHEGQPIGAIYGLQSGHRAFFYQSGFSPEASKLSPGTIMIAEFMRRSIEEGITSFDFLRGQERYKLRWQPDVIDHNVRAIWPADASLVGQAAKLHHRVDRWLRDRFEN